MSRSGAAGSYTVSVQVSGYSTDVEQSIQENEPVALLKLRLYENPPAGATVAPPTVSQLHFAGFELCNNSDIYADHGCGKERGSN